MDGMSSLSESVRAALATVIDPEIRRPITDLGMVRSADVAESPAGAVVTVGIDLTTSGCPLKDTITKDTTAAVTPIGGVAQCVVEMGVLTAAQRPELRSMLRGGEPEPEPTEPRIFSFISFSDESDTYDWASRCVDACSATASLSWNAGEQVLAVDPQWASDTDQLDCAQHAAVSRLSTSHGLGSGSGHWRSRRYCRHHFPAADSRLPIDLARNSFRTHN